MLLAWGAVILLAVGVFGMSFAPAALGAGAVGGSSLQELAENGEETNTATTSTATTTATTGSSTTNDQKTILIAIVAAVVLLSGIAFVITRDARRVAPATDADLAERRAGSRDPAVLLRKRRAKAKAARKQRRQNR